MNAAAAFDPHAAELLGAAMADLGELVARVDSGPDADAVKGAALIGEGRRGAGMVGGVQAAIALEADVEPFLRRDRQREVGRLAEIGEEAPRLLDAIAADELANAELGRRGAEKAAGAARPAPRPRPRPRP